MLDTVLQNIIKLSGFDKYHISQEHFMFDPNTKKLYDDITNIGSSFGLVSKAILLVKTTEDVTHFSGLKINIETCLLYTSPSPRDGLLSRMPSSA